MTRNDVIMMSLPKTMKGLDERYPKMQMLSNLSNFVKRYGHLNEILAFLLQALTNYGSIT